jgi:hypothetical protein
LCALNITSQQFKLNLLLRELLLGRVRRGGEMPTVAGKNNVGEDENKHSAENDFFSELNVAPHQVLE